MNTTVLPRLVRSVPLPLLAQHRGIARTTWIERLAKWADQQPPHHHLGSWTVL